MSLSIVSIAPSVLNVNGDAENAKVLAQRARWAGLEVTLHEVERAEELPEQIDLVVIGSGSDSDLAAVREAFLPALDRIRAWATEKVALLAVGSGWELLSWGIELDANHIIEGFGVFAGRAIPAPQRIVGDLLCDSPWGALVGFENHARDYVGAEKASLGQVRHGSGNGIPQASGRLHEGIRMGTAVGTHLHGPVCAKNPALADALLTDAAAHAGLRYERSDRAAELDAVAANVLARLEKRLEP